MTTHIEKRSQYQLGLARAREIIADTIDARIAEAERCKRKCNPGTRDFYIGKSAGIEEVKRSLMVRLTRAINRQEKFEKRYQSRE